VSQNAVTAGLAGFLESPQARALGLDPAAVRRVAQAFLETCLLDLGTAPETLDGQSVEEAVARGLPRRLAPKDGAAEHLGAVLEAYFEHLGETRVVTQAFEIRMGLERGVPAAEQAVRSGSNASEQVRERQDPVVHRADKLGRNDPCFCGSGKKFKKCCGKPG
jgi:uncharacterized protein YecA (UPF0149 family)